MCSLQVFFYILYCCSYLVCNGGWSFGSRQRIEEFFEMHEHRFGICNRFICRVHVLIRFSNISTLSLFFIDTTLHAFCQLLYPRHQAADPVVCESKASLSRHLQPVCESLLQIRFSLTDHLCYFITSLLNQFTDFIPAFAPRLPEFFFFFFFFFYMQTLS